MGKERKGVSMLKTIEKLSKTETIGLVLQEKMKKGGKCGFWPIYYNMMDFAVFSFTSNVHNNNKISTPLLLSYFQSDKLKYCYRVQY